jgi:hypothetical protein
MLDAGCRMQMAVIQWQMADGRWQMAEKAKKDWGLP